MPAVSSIDTIVGGCYRLTRPLGEGGMGVVYEAQHLRLGGKVAIKILSSQHATDPKFRDRFRREARAASQIRHPNVVQITDFGDTPNGSVFFAMELLEGRDLHHVLRAHAPAPFPWPRAQHLLAQATDALAAAHRSGVVHRDVKPSNIFVLEGPGLQDFVKLLDFGIAKIVVPTVDSALVKNLTGTGEIFGTAKYMAPEQAYGGSNDARMDVYSLGVVAYELLTGRVPFAGQSNFEIITRHVYEAPRPLRELRPDLPAALEAVVLRAMEKRPENRFATMEEFGQALRQVGGVDVRAGAGGSSVPRSRAHTDTGANTVARTPRKDLLSIAPPVVQQPMPPVAAPQAPPAAALGPVAPVVRKTIPAIAAAPSPAQAGGQAVPTPMHAVRPPAAHPPPSPLVAPLPAAPRPGAAYDDTSRKLATTRPPTASSRTGLVALAVVGTIAVASLSVTGVMLAMGSDEQEPESAHAILPTPASQGVSLEPATVPPTAGLAVHPGANESSTGAEEPPELVTPVPATEVVAPPAAPPPASGAKPPSTKSSSSKPRPRPTTTPAADPDPDGELSKQIGGEIGRRIKRNCETLGNGKKVVIELEVGANGRISKQVIGVFGPLRACIIEAIGNPQFPKATKLELKPVIGKCVEAYGSTVSKCK